MKQRILFGLPAAAALVLLLLKGSMWMVAAVVLGCATLAYLEFDRLFFPNPSRRRQGRVLLLILATIWAMCQNQMAGWFSIWVAFIILGIFRVVQSNRSGDFVRETRELALEILGLMYVVSLFGFLVPIWSLPWGRHYLLLLFILVFFGDTGAYFIGIRLGRHRLATKLSPKKSLEGAFAAVVVSTLGALLWFYVFHPKPISSDYLLKLLIFAPIASVLAQLGDLFESLFKRSQSQKDSGSFLPGHGGILDRLDGLSLVAPVYYMFLIFVLEQP